MKREECCRCDGRGYFLEVIPGTEDYYTGPDCNEVYCSCLKGDKLRRNDQGLK